MTTKKCIKSISVTRDTHEDVVHGPQEQPRPFLSWDVSNIWSHTLSPPLTFLQSSCSWWHDSRWILLQNLISLAILFFYPLKLLLLLFSSCGFENIFCVDNCVSKQHPNRKKLMPCRFKWSISNMSIHTCFCCLLKLAVAFQMPEWTQGCARLFSELWQEKCI